MTTLLQLGVSVAEVIFKKCVCFFFILGMEIRSIEISYVREQSARFHSEVGQLRKSLPEVKEHKKSLEELEEGKEKLGSTSRSVEPQNSEKVTKQPLHLEGTFRFRVFVRYIHMHIFEAKGPN